MGKYAVIKLNNGRILVYETNTQIFIQSISYKGCNNGLSIGLTNLMFDYCPIESELDFLDSFEEEASSPQDPNQWLERLLRHSKMNFLFYNLPPVNRVEITLRLLFARYQRKMNYLYRGKRSTIVALLVLSGDLTEMGNSVKVRYIPIPFSGANISEVITTHQESHNLLAITKNVKAKLVEGRYKRFSNYCLEMTKNFQTEDLVRICSNLSDFRALANIAEYPQISRAYVLLSQEYDYKNAIKIVDFNLEYVQSFSSEK